jgi:monoamine oxidase
MIHGIENLSNKLKLNCAVEAIKWKSGSASVQFVPQCSGESQTVAAGQVLITAPLGVLQAQPGAQGAIRFHPEPGETLHAAQELRFGQVLRLILRFQEPVWEKSEDYGETGFLLSNEKDFPTWWTPLPVRAPSMTGWSSGPHADDLLGRPKVEIVNRAIHDLSRILSTREAKLKELLQAAYFHDWHGDGFARGAYSYVPAHAMAAREKLARPVAGTLFFAGEATELNGHSATVHGAIASGRRAARQVLDC